MPNVVVVVMPDIEKCQDVLDSWEKYGVSGVTVLESLGMHKLRQMRAQRDDLPLFPSLRHLMESEEYHHRTAFVVVDDDFDLEGLIEATERAVGAVTSRMQSNQRVAHEDAMQQLDRMIQTHGRNKKKAA